MWYSGNGDALFQMNPANCDLDGDDNNNMDSDEEDDDGCRADDIDDGGHSNDDDSSSDSATTTSDRSNSIYEYDYDHGDDVSCISNYLSAPG